MNWQFSPFIVIPLITAVCAVGLAVYFWPRRRTPGGRALIGIMLAGALWSAASALELMLPVLDTRLLVVRIQYLAVISLPPLWLLFCLQYAAQSSSSQGAHWLSGRRQALLWATPVIVLLLVWTNDAYGLMWSGAAPAGPEPGAPLVFEYAPGFWVMVVYNYLLVISGSFILGRAALRRQDLYRRQVITLLAAAVIPLIFNLAYLAGLTPGIDLTPLAFTLSGALLAYSLFRQHLLDLMPVARDALVDSMTDGMLALDARGRLIDFNQGARKLLNLSDSQLGLSADRALEDWPALSRYLRSGVIEHADLFLENNGDKRRIDLQIKPFQDRSGRMAGLLVLLRDITYYWRIEEQLRLESAALQAAANAVIITDREGRILSANPAFTMLTGYLEEEVYGKNLSVLRSGEHDDAFYKKLWDTILKGNIWHGEIVNRRKNGNLYTEEMTIAPVRNSNDRITHFIAVKQDISDRKALERMRDDLTRTIVHDLRNPLTALLTSLKVLENGVDQRGEAAEEQKITTLALAVQNARRMASLVDAILEHSRLENGELPLQRVRISLHSLAAEAIHMQSPLMTARKVQIINQVPEDLPLISIDAQIIGRVLQNLLDNALKFSPPGELVTIEAQLSDDGGAVQVRVVDCGPGFPPRLRERLFQRFAAGDERGSGLGLSFCRLAVEAHQGSIWVEGSDGQGARIAFQLPVEKPDDTPPSDLVVGSD